jgi:type VI secretion system protein VasG
MTDISLETVTGKLNRIGYDAFLKGLRSAKAAGHRHLELAHWLVPLLDANSDLSLTVDHFGLDRGRLLADLAVATEGLRRNETGMPSVANTVVDLLDRAWHQATLLFGETQIRSGHLLVGALRSADLRRTLLSLSAEWRRVPVETLVAEHRSIWVGSEEENLRPIDGAGPVAAGTEGAPAQRGQTALDRFSKDLTAEAAAGRMDPVRGRDDEVRQLIDVLMRRRQNNPILTGEAGVGKTAVVEGFAQAVSAGSVPPPLQGVRVLALDIGLMQAGASMKGEFEQRLRSVIDEVQASPTPIILFIDEAHTLIGAGGQAGTGDAANLLKPALARGTLRTIAATTWAEYRQYIEKDPALTRRFQPIHVGEPGLDQACDMLRGLIGPMQVHHGVRISDAAIRAAVTLSHRYIPARQLPDKAVSLLDTACARVAVSQTAVPAAIEDLRSAIDALESERDALIADRDLGHEAAERLESLAAQIEAARRGLDEHETAWADELSLVQKIHSLRGELGPAPLDDADAAERRAQIMAELRAYTDQLETIAPERRMIHPHVEEGSVAAVVSDWTGIPVGKMVRDEVETVLRLADILGERVVGQHHGLATIARRIETNRAGLENPNKPIGVFMLCGPSGVGKTETALALAEALYGGESNIITINMSEFQEAHSVSTLKGAPPGYVGHGEGGRLTEAVRRRPYSVILLDEVEKAHPDVHELFFQVFDKGVMEDGTGRRIDFRNTLIILTSNVGTEAIMRAGAKSDGNLGPEALERALRPELLQVFPPALLGRIVTIPYLPLSQEMLAGIARLQLDRVGQRVRDTHDTEFVYDDTVVDHIVARCTEPETGGRMVDNILTNALLPELSRGFLRRALARERPRRVRVGIAADMFTLSWDDPNMDLARVPDQAA